MRMKCCVVLGCLAMTTACDRIDLEGGELRISPAVQPDASVDSETGVATAESAMLRGAAGSRSRVRPGIELELSRPVLWSEVLSRSGIDERSATQRCRPVEIESTEWVAPGRFGSGNLYYLNNNFDEDGTPLMGSISAIPGLGAGPVAFDPATGAVARAYDNGEDGAKSAVRIDDFIYFAGDDGQGVRRIAASEPWSGPASSYQAGPPAPAAESIATDGTLLFTNDDVQRGVVHAWSIEESGDGFTLANVWSTDLGGRVRGISYYRDDDGRGYVLASNGGAGGDPALRGVFAIDAETGAAFPVVRPGGVPFRVPGTDPVYQVVAGEGAGGRVMAVSTTQHVLLMPMIAVDEVCGVGSALVASDAAAGEGVYPIPTPGLAVPGAFYGLGLRDGVLYVSAGDRLARLRLARNGRLSAVATGELSRSMGVHRWELHGELDERYADLSVRARGYRVDGSLAVQGDMTYALRGVIPLIDAGESASYEQFVDGLPVSRMRDARGRRLESYMNEEVLAGLVPPDELDPRLVSDADLAEHVGVTERLWLEVMTESFPTAISGAAQEEPIGGDAPFAYAFDGFAGLSCTRLANSLTLRAPSLALAAPSEGPDLTKLAWDTIVGAGLVARAVLEWLRQRTTDPASPPLGLDPATQQEVREYLERCIELPPEEPEPNRDDRDNRRYLVPDALLDEMEDAVVTRDGCIVADDECDRRETYNAVTGLQFVRVAGDRGVCLSSCTAYGQQSMPGASDQCCNIASTADGPDGTTLCCESAGECLRNAQAPDLSGSLWLYNTDFAESLAERRTRISVTPFQAWNRALFPSDWRPEWVLNAFRAIQNVDPSCGVPLTRNFIGMAPNTVLAVGVGVADDPATPQPVDQRVVLEISVVWDPTIQHAQIYHNPALVDRKPTYMVAPTCDQCSNDADCATLRGELPFCAGRWACNERGYCDILPPSVVDLECQLQAGQCQVGRCSNELRGCAFETIPNCPGPGPGPCTSPRTCGPTDCGLLPDGCGGTIDCGTCTPAPCVPRTCGASECGPQSDGCNGTLDCGPCPCVPKSSCGPSECGTLPNGCGGSIDCGACSACVPQTCRSLGVTCGTASDGCGNTLTCGGPCDNSPGAPPGTSLQPPPAQCDGVVIYSVLVGCNIGSCGFDGWEQPSCGVSNPAGCTYANPARGIYVPTTCRQLSQCSYITNNYRLFTPSDPFTPPPPPPVPQSVDPASVAPRYYSFCN